MLLKLMIIFLYFTHFNLFADTQTSGPSQINLNPTGYEALSNIFDNAYGKVTIKYRESSDPEKVQTITTHFYLTNKKIAFGEMPLPQKNSELQDSNSISLNLQSEKVFSYEVQTPTEDDLESEIIKSSLSDNTDKQKESNFFKTSQFGISEKIKNTFSTFDFLTFIDKKIDEPIRKFVQDLVHSKSKKQKVKILSYGFQHALTLPIHSLANLVFANNLDSDTLDTTFNEIASEVNAPSRWKLKMSYLKDKYSKSSRSSLEEKLGYTVQYLDLNDYLNAFQLLSDNLKVSAYMSKQKDSYNIDGTGDEDFVINVDSKEKSTYGLKFEMNFN